jgi:hypothetical protein
MNHLVAPITGGERRIYVQYVIIWTQTNKIFSHTAIIKREHWAKSYTHKQGFLKGAASFTHVLDFFYQLSAFPLYLHVCEDLFLE